ncbi:hypothetical protein JXA47_10950 [Candidatus Sumerlaeota bacterium]|nr:hypothetical protein [Candidatus Sumerlaeota bacterium]
MLTILAELELHRHEDLYRFGYPRDVTGQNVFRASLVRLANWEAQWPGRWPDIVAFSKALAYESLGEFTEARLHFERVAAMDTDLSEAADEHLAVIERFAELESFEPQGQTLTLFLLDFEDHVEDWRREAVRRRDTPWESITRVAWEQSEMQLAEALREARFSLSDGEERYRASCEALIENHGESHRIHRHWLRLGDYHRDLAERLVVFNPPSQTAFDLDTFESLITAARAIYLQVERADGFHEKLEARARLAALEEFAARVREEAR